MQTTDEKFSVAVFGTGVVGESAQRAKRAVRKFSDKFSKIYILNRTPDDPKFEGIDFALTGGSRNPVKQEELKRRIFIKRTVEEVVNASNIAIVAIKDDYSNSPFQASLAEVVKKAREKYGFATPKENEDDNVNTNVDYRLKELAQNAGIIAWLGEQFQNYKGHVIIATNPPDILAHLFAYYSGLWSRTSGYNHVDTHRLRATFFRDFKKEGISTKDVDCVYAPGYHGGGCIPLTSRLLKSKKSNAASRIKLQNDLRTHVRLLKNQRREFELPCEYQQTFEDILKAITQEDRGIGNSVFGYLANFIGDEWQESELSDFVERTYEKLGASGDRGTFIGFPMIYKDLFARILRHELDDWETREFCEVYARTHNLSWDVIDFMSAQGKLQIDDDKILKNQPIGNPPSLNEVKVRSIGIKDFEKSRRPALKTANTALLDITPSIKKEREIIEIAEHSIQPEESIDNIIIGAGEHRITVLQDGKTETFDCKYFIRNASLLRIRGIEYLALGFVNSGDAAVELRPLTALGKQGRLFTLKSFNIDKEPERGIRSVISIDDAVYASHSGKGIFRWEFDKPNDGKLPYFAKNIHFLNALEFAGKRYLVFSGDGIYFLQEDSVKGRRELSDVKIACSTVFEDKVYFGTRAGKIQVIDPTAQEHKLRGLFSVHKRPHVIRADRFNEDLYIFVGSGDTNLIVENLDSISDDNDRLCRFQDPKDRLAVESIEHNSGKLYVAAGTRIYELDLARRTTLNVFDTEQQVLSVVKARKLGEKHVKS